MPGKADSLEETPFQTARREAWEEIGLPADDRELPPSFRTEHLCELPANLALTELGVRPCVAFLHSDGITTGSAVDAEARLIPKLEPKEVSDIFTAPLYGFVRVNHEGDADKGAGASWYKGIWGMWNETRWRMHNFYVPKIDSKGRSSDEAYRVFGMTARILVDVAKVAYAETPNFEHNEEMGDEAMIRRLIASGRLSGTRKSGSQLTRVELATGAKL